MADEETLLIVVGVNEPAGDAVGAMAADLAGVGVEHVHAIDLDLELLGCTVGHGHGQDVDIRLAEDDEEIALAGVFRLPAMCRSAFMRALRMGMRPSLLKSAALASKLKAQAISTSKPTSAASRAAAARSAGGQWQIRKR